MNFNVTDFELLRSLIGHHVLFLAPQATAHLNRSGEAFVGTHTIFIPTSDFSVDEDYKADFIEISTEWIQSQLGEDHHLFSITRTPNLPKERTYLGLPTQDEPPLGSQVPFRGEWLSAPVEKIEIYRSSIINEVVGSETAETISYDSHIRFVAGAYAVTLTTEHGSILGEIEIYAASVTNDVAGDAFLRNAFV